LYFVGKCLDLADVQKIFISGSYDCNFKIWTTGASGIIVQNSLQGISIWKKKIAIQEIFTALEISTFTKPLKVIVKPYI
jgi:photosystem II stability/assembly factor-like uncharacterized protein